MNYLKATVLIMMRKLVALIIILSGLSTITVSAYWGSMDYIALVNATNLIEEKAKSGDSKGLELIKFRSDAHRLNVGFEGTWMVLGGIVTSLGFLVGKD